MSVRTLRPFSRAWRHHWIDHPLQAAVVIALFRVLGWLPPGWASALGGRLGRLVGPLVPRPNRRARRNLALCFPERSEAERERILKDMWDHLGRVAFEYPVLHRLSRPGSIEIRGAEHIVLAYGQDRPIIFVSGHIGHWELAPVLAAKYGMRLAAIYRPPNNRFIDRMIRRIRESCGLDLVVRGRDSVREVLQVVADGGYLALLADQKRSYGIPVPLFGRPAMTGPILAQLALRYDAIVLPVRVERLAGTRFRVSCEPPLAIPRSGDREADILAVMTEVNAILERWIREQPAQWLWPHRRWDN